MRMEIPAAVRDTRILATVLVTASALAVAASVPRMVQGEALPKATTDKVYVTQPDADRVAVYRATWKSKVKLKSLGTIDGFDEPLEVAVGDAAALVVNGSGEFVAKIDTSTDKLVANIEVGKDLRSVAITPDGRFGLVAYGKKSVAVIDVEQEEVIRTLKVGKTPWRIRMDHKGVSAVTVNVKSRSLSVIDVAAATADRVAGRGAGAVVNTIKKGVCKKLSGGLDVFLTEGANIFVTWTCGELYTGPDSPPLTFEGDFVGVQQFMSIDPEAFEFFGTPAMTTFYIGDFARLIGVHSIHTNQRQTPQFPGGWLLVMQTGDKGVVETFVLAWEFMQIAPGMGTACCGILDGRTLSVMSLGCKTDQLGFCDLDDKQFKPSAWGKQTADRTLGHADAALFGRPPGR